eukprot:TRINITY_DN2379_c0_g1_i1.p1 TRINITY_DN2379_c0_g1~~TRINITY_DN2379_c0_g1_i1.p1  ORF type:complete len:182 (+),score=35.44 TRINITY_DN2379_c0_g1_i1:84-629(+)
MASASANRIGSVARSAVFRSMCTRASSLRADLNYSGAMQMLGNNACKIVSDHVAENKSSVAVLGQATQIVEDLMYTVINTPVAVRGPRMEVESKLEPLEECMMQILTCAEENNLPQILEMLERVGNMLDQFDGSNASGGSFVAGPMILMPAPPILQAAGGGGAMPAHIVEAFDEDSDDGGD